MEEKNNKNNTNIEKRLNWEEDSLQLDKGQKEGSNYIELIKKFVGLAIIFGVINLVLWGAQELYYRNDTKKINEIEVYLENEKQTINALETKINFAEIEIGRKESQLNNYKSLGYTNKYNAGVDDFNYLLSTYKQDLDNYNSKLTSYNAKVDEVNTLIKKSGSRWYLIPMPLPGKTIKSKL